MKWKINSNQSSKKLLHKMNYKNVSMILQDIVHSNNSFVQEKHRNKDEERIWCEVSKLTSGVDLTKDRLIAI